MHPLTFWDIAAGILIAAFLISAIAQGYIRRSDRSVTIVAGIIAAALIAWRSSCWYWGIECDASSNAAALAAESAVPADTHR